MVSLAGPSGASHRTGEGPGGEGVGAADPYRCSQPPCATMSWTIMALAPPPPGTKGIGNTGRRRNIFLRLCWKCCSVMVWEDNSPLLQHFLELGNCHYCCRASCIRAPCFRIMRKDVQSGGGGHHFMNATPPPASQHWGREISRGG